MTDELSPHMKRRVKVQTIYSAWKKIQSAASQDAEVCEKLGREALTLGEPLLAFDIFSLIEEDKRTAKGRKNYIQAMILCGSLDRARLYLKGILQKEHASADLYAMLGRIYKDLWRSQKSEEERIAFAESALEAYQMALSLGKNSSEEFYFAVNVATTALILRQTFLVHDMAHLAWNLCKRKMSEQAETAFKDFWLQATIAESLLLLFKRDEAKEYYARAVALADTEFGAIASMKRQCRLILNLQGQHDQDFLKVFSLPKVAALVGHMIDAPTRRIPRFPATLCDKVKQQIEECIDRNEIKIGYAGAASGSDLLFLEAMLNRGHEIVVILPFATDVFREQSVGPVGGEWDLKFERVLREASQIIQLHEDKDIHDNQAHVLTSLYVDGLAKLRGENMETEVMQIAVWDGVETTAEGGTGDTVKRWKSQGDNPHIISLADHLPPSPLRRPILEYVHDEDSVPSRRKLRSMIFADTVGFSKLKDSHVLSYVQSFMQTLAEVIKASGYHAVVTNTWGDGLFLVLPNVEQAALLSLSLQEHIYRVDFRALKLPEYLSLRIGLHFGPVFETFDPLKHSMNVFGAHVSRAARIEPIVPPGSVYASQAFAAQAAAENIKTFSCEYVGQQNLAKHYGSMPVYKISRRHF